MQWCAPTYSAQTAIVFFFWIMFKSDWHSSFQRCLTLYLFVFKRLEAPQLLCLWAHQFSWNAKFVFTNEVEPLGNWVIGPGDPLQFRSLARAWLWQAYDSKVVVPYLPNKPRHLTHVWQCALSGGGLFSFTPECRDECEAEKRQDTYLCYLICATARRFCFFRFFVGSLW